MNNTRVVGLAIAMWIATASSSVWAQLQGSASAPAGAEAVSGAAAPTGKQADRALRRKVYAAIGKDKAINAGNISVGAKNGAVTLNGTVSDTAQIGKVEEIAKSVAGVTSVSNKLTVKKSFGGM
ncbi:BON domain-containing protein [Paraburkholderia lycopersici]|uniref:BON domain-containing protein n=1 Tax=Paraburkholderia lycopersici TaxID=416944 RepID=A0A1G6HGQ7_9BURK|nr:BON domain-containing protein [Paraburkholderia lycopersici]SDB93333.1 BON domain-containing protein [Paraburkholderia lycopersici]